MKIINAILRGLFLFTAFTLFTASPRIFAQSTDLGLPAVVVPAERVETTTPTPLSEEAVEAGFDDPKFLAGPTSAMLPDAPGWTLPAATRPMPPCPTQIDQHPDQNAPSTQPCIQVNPFRRFLDNTAPIPLTPREKAYLAFRNFVEPANIITITGTAAFTVGANSHTAYGPGWKGFARNTGYSFSQDATGEFFGTYLIPSLLHEDPHYHREPKSSVTRRIFHAISRTAVAQHDDGRMMPNYATLLTYPISAEISNLYVPGINGNAASTVKRIATGLATDPIGNIITEFLPDVAKRLNIRVIFVQRILNSVTAGASAGAGGS